MEDTIMGLTGVVWAYAGAAFAVIGGGIGSAIGLTTALNAASGVITEDSDKFGRVLPLAAMPATQGIYGFITGILVMVFFGLMGATEVPSLTASAGFSIFLACLPVATVCLFSAVYQGLTSAGASGMVARRSEESGRAMIFPAMVETYAVFALIATVLMLLSLQGMYGA